MKTRTKQTSDTQDLCAVCGEHEVIPTTITHQEERDGHPFIFRNVPAYVCEACGEVWLDGAVIEVIERQLAEGVPTRTVETPVYEFSPLPAS